MFGAAVHKWQMINRRGRTSWNGWTYYNYVARSWAAFNGNGKVLKRDNKNAMVRVKV